MKTVQLALFLALGVCLAAATASAEEKKDKTEAKKVDTRVFEMRTYYPEPGKMTALHARFRDHTNTLFRKHGIDIIGFWVPSDPKNAEEKLVYILAYPSKEAADKSWKDFRADPDWKTALAASEKNGKLVNKVDSIFLSPTDYSPIK